ncbi:WYL domain-containing protein, partial [Streptomyces sp. T-3]|nr:WYL domain-containing protein [Streptomyces sp. T-3]
ARATVTDAPVRRRAGVELGDVWEQLRRRVEDRTGSIAVSARVRRDRLDMFVRMNGAYLTGPPTGEGEWAAVELAYSDVREARSLLSFADRMEVLSPPEVREELARAAASIMALYAENGPAPR